MIKYDAPNRFVAQIEATEKGIKSSGNVPYRIPIDVVELKVWHDRNHLNVCGTSLSEFIQVKLTQIVRKRSND